MHYILHFDKKHYVYMRDVNEDHLLFAIPKAQHDVFMDIVNMYNSEPSEVPDDYTLEVLKMTEVSDDVYSLENKNPVRYPINHLYYVLAFPIEEAYLH